MALATLSFLLHIKYTLSYRIEYRLLQVLLSKCHF